MSKIPLNLPLTQEIRINLLEGKLELPEQFISLVGKQHKQQMQTMFKSLWHLFLIGENKTTSLPYWSDNFECKHAFNNFIRHLSKAGWITTNVKPSRNWAEVSMNEDKILDFVDRNELVAIKRQHKYSKYKMTNTLDNHTSNMTKLGKEKQDTGLNRQGFALAGNTEFKYDLETLENHRSVIETNLIKSMTKLAETNKNLFCDELNYADVSKEILQSIIDDSCAYTTGKNLNDSRGRAISKILGKVFNPISNKDARSLLILTPAQVSKRN